MWWGSPAGTAIRPGKSPTRAGTVAHGGLSPPCAPVVLSPPYGIPSPLPAARPARGMAIGPCRGPDGPGFGPGLRSHGPGAGLPAQPRGINDRTTASGRVGPGPVGPTPTRQPPGTMG